MIRRFVVPPVLGLALVAGAAVPADATHDFRPGVDDGRAAVAARAHLPLAGRLIVLDPGHQIGNHNFLREIDRLVPAGGFDKPCNTTGTSTDGGYPEATFTWQVTRLLERRLQRLGARVLRTRHANSQHRWGP
jgi:N-acetylmuramoyl-L-alanine amidase